MPARSRSEPRGGSIELQLCKLVGEAPTGDGWLHELKFDGYRIAARLDGGAVRLESRRGRDWTDAFPTVAAAVARLAAREAVIDGEVAVVLPDGRTSFGALQNGFGPTPPVGLTYFVFDLLELDGEPVAHLPLEARKGRLQALVEASPVAPMIRYAEHVVGHGAELFDLACRKGAEGIVSKRRDQPYTPGRGGGWLKVKCVARQEMVIGGFTDPEGSRQGIGALLVGVQRGGRLDYAGKVGTGFTQQAARALRQRLAPLEQPGCPFAGPPPREDAHWVKPIVVAEVAFGEWTGDGKIRHASFQGLRADKTAAEVVEERPEKPPERPERSAKPVVAGVAISNAGRVIYPAVGHTKLDVARYLEEVAARMVPQVAGRPLTLLWCATGLDGGCRFMKHSKVWGPSALRRVSIREKTKMGEYLVADDAAGLVALAQMGMLEIHTWNSTTEHLEQPDRIVIDLDPGPAVPWKDVIEGARLVRAGFRGLGLDSLVKTTGGVGLHLVVPIVPDHDVAAIFALSSNLATILAAEYPDRFTTHLSKEHRQRLILLDYLRNNRTNTSVAAYSPRARPTAPVSMPIDWDELSPRLRSDHFTIATIARRLREPDPWADYARIAEQRLTEAALRAVDLEPAPLAQERRAP